MNFTYVKKTKQTKKQSTNTVASVTVKNNNITLLMPFNIGRNIHHYLLKLILLGSTCLPKHSGNEPKDCPVSEFKFGKVPKRRLEQL